MCFFVLRNFDETFLVRGVWRHRCKSFFYLELGLFKIFLKTLRIYLKNSILSFKNETLTKKCKIRSEWINPFLQSRCSAQNTPIFTSILLIWCIREKDFIRCNKCLFIWDTINWVRNSSTNNNNYDQKEEKFSFSPKTIKRNKIQKQFAIILDFSFCCSLFVTQKRKKSN